MNTSAEEIDYFDYSVLSNTAFLLPFVLAVLAGVYWFAVVSLATFVFSSLWHLYKTDFLKLADLFCAYLLIFSNVYLGFILRFDLLNVSLAVSFIAIGLLYFFRQNSKNYEIYHSVWHLLCAVGTAFLLI